MLRVGERAPDFTTILDGGTEFRLSEWAGKKHVIIYFYPKDFTIGCTKEACSFRDNYKEILKNDAIIVGVSTDTNESHRAFREKYALPFPLVSDVEKQVTGLYDADRRFSFPGAQRVTYVIDKNGIVAGAYRHELAIGRHQDDVLSTLRRLNSDEPVDQPTRP
jgi:thioredoxin-dependent peroxiredoxin